MEAAGLVPDTILCSTARRAAETLDLIAGRLGARPDIVRDSLLTVADEAGLLHRLRLLEEARRHVMFIGHNPTMPASPYGWSAAGPRRREAGSSAASRRAPSPRFELPDRPWESQGPGDGALLVFLTPAIFRARNAPPAQDPGFHQSSGDSMARKLAIFRGRSSGRHSMLTETMRPKTFSGLARKLSG